MLKIKRLNQKFIDLRAERFRGLRIKKWKNFIDLVVIDDNFLLWCQNYTSDVVYYQGNNQ